MKGILRALWMMARPLIMVSVVMVFAAGGLVARALGYVVEPGTTAWGVAALILAVVSIHYVNEYADRETDALTTPTLYSGGSGALPRGLAPPWVALAAGWGALFAGLLVAGVAVALGYLSGIGFVLLVLGIFWGWMYSLPPLKLAWRGWGELDNALLGGLLLPMYGYTVQTGHFDWLVALWHSPFALLVFNNLLGTTWADRLADAQVGKYMLASRWPAWRLRRLHWLVGFLSFALLFAFLLARILPLQIPLFSLVALPFVVWGCLRYTRIHSPAPSSNAMIVFLVMQLIAWFLLGN